MSLAETRRPAPAWMDRQLREVHLVGICGSGMKPLAHALMSLGVAVSGSDLDTEKAVALRDRGARVYTGHAADHVGTPDALVYSTAISSENPEMQAARQRGIPLVHRSEMLAYFLRRRESVLVAGTHGKTTSTTLLTLLLEAAGMDPWGFVGGSVPAFGGNLRIGGERLAVAEADESDGTFLNLPRDHAIITNIEPEHLNYWQTEERMFDGFEEFALEVPAQGNLVLCADDPGVSRLLARLARPVITWSTKAQSADYHAADIQLSGSGSSFVLYKGQRRLGPVRLGIPGLHNVSNAVGTLALAMALGGDFEAMAPALAGFHGVDRRFTRKPGPYGSLVIDDYGHHPTEIAVTVQAARLLANERGGRLIVAIQPHRYTRTASFFDAFGPAVRGADLAVVMEIYAAGEEPIPGVSGAKLAEKAASQLDIPVLFSPDLADTEKIIREHLKKDDTVLLLGAGSVTKLGYLLSSS